MNKRIQNSYINSLWGCTAFILFFIVPQLIGNNLILLSLIIGSAIICVFLQIRVICKTIIIDHKINNWIDDHYPEVDSRETLFQIVKFTIKWNRNIEFKTLEKNLNVYDPKSLKELRESACTEMRQLFGIEGPYYINSINDLYKAIIKKKRTIRST